MNEDSICMKCVHLVNGYYVPPDDNSPGCFVESEDYECECGIGCEENFNTDGGCYQYRGLENVIIDDLRAQRIDYQLDAADAAFNAGINRAIKIAEGKNKDGAD